MTPKTQERLCKQCGAELHGRIDQKFCSDYCRNQHNNRENREVTNFMRNVNNVLRKNRRILERLNPKEKSKTTRETLLFEGFQFNYFTNTYVTKSGKTYFFCYDHGYLELEDGTFALVRRKEYVK